MPERDPALGAAVDGLLDTLPPVWDRIRSNLRSAAIEEFGITLEQFHVLRHIRRGCRTVGELAAKRQVSRSAVSQAVAALVAKGLVTRAPESGDRRCVLLGIAPRASEAMDANFEENRAWMDSRMASLEAGDLEAVRASMEILRRVFIPGED